MALCRPSLRNTSWTCTQKYETMRRGLGLCVLALLSLQTTLGQSAEVFIFCDDPTVGKAVTSALNKFNKGVVTGHKLALFQVTSASKEENGWYRLKFTTRRSNCSASDTQPWTDCDYLPIDKKPIKCNATVHINETNTDTKHVECQIEGQVLSGRVHCLGCPEVIDANSEELKVPLSVSISKYNTMSDHTHLFTLHEVGPATRQILAGFRFAFSFDMRRTNCTKAEHKDLQEHCVADPKNVELANCNSVVDMAPWRLEAPNTHLECESGPMPPVILTRRRPAGWSPLRTVLFDHAAPQPPPPPPPPPLKPTKAKAKDSKGSAKEESSEEDVSVASPFHCPSKPWKPFVPVHAGSPPSKAMPTEATAEPAFSDTGLPGL